MTKFKIVTCSEKKCTHQKRGFVSNVSDEKGKVERQM